MTKLDIHSLFFPSQHITDPKWFAGRKSDIERALQSLCSPGASMVVFGERGCGKTSFVEMIKLLAMGESYLLYKHNFHKKFSPSKLQFKTICFTCNSETDTTAKVLHNLITSPNGIRKLIHGRTEREEETLKARVGANIFKILQMGIDAEKKISIANFEEENVFELFTNLITTIANDLLAPKEGLLIVVDEFDLVKDSQKMASLIKTLSKDNVKFLLSGIAESYDKLLKGHRSIMRQLIYGRIQIPLMSEEEIKEVFCLLEENTKGNIRIEPNFVVDVKKKSNGFPYYVQLFGKLAAEEYLNERGEHLPMIIHSQHLNKGLKKLGLYEYQMESDYLSIVKDNPYKEFILRFLARQTAKKIRDEDIFSYCFKHDIRQPLPKNTLTSLLANRDPQFLIREHSDSNYVSFLDSLFKTFVNSRRFELLWEDGEGQLKIPSDLRPNS